MKFKPMRQIILVVAGMLLLQLVPAMANDTPAPLIDWTQQAQHKLVELKAKLNLAPGQNEAWNAWSSGMSEEVRQRFERMKAWQEKHKAPTQAVFEGTTPERMAHRIEHLHARIAFMQENLTRLEAAQVRTKTFYDQLDTNQKTIFDLYAQQIRQQIRERFGHHGHNCGQVE